MKSLYRLTLLLAGVVLLVPVQAATAKRSYRLGDRTLKEGHRGSDVRALQRMLTKAGLETGVDGVFGSQTRETVEEFERYQQRKVDGKVSRFDALVLLDVATNGGAVASAAATGGALPKKMAKPKPPPPPPLLLGPGMVATVGADGLAVAPALAPPAVQAVINAGNVIARMPYLYGGGHGKWEDAGYDCSGSVSYALHGAGMLEQALTSGDFASWGDPGPGQWITIYANGGHVFMVVAGLRFDTSGRASAGTRWQADMRPDKGYVVRHPPGL